MRRSCERNSRHSPLTANGSPRGPKSTGRNSSLLHSADNSAPPRQIGQGPARVEHAAGVVAGWEAARLGRREIPSLCHRGGARASTMPSIDSGSARSASYEWSPDSRYLAYEIPADEPVQPGAHLGCEDEDGGYEGSDPMFNASSPTWDPRGKYLYFLSDRVVNPYLDRFEARFIVDNAAVPVALALQADGTLPFAPRGDTDPKKPHDKKGEEAEIARRRRTRRPSEGGEGRADPDRLRRPRGPHHPIPRSPRELRRASRHSRQAALSSATQNRGMMPPEASRRRARGRNPVHVRHREGEAFDAGDRGHGIRRVAGQQGPGVPDQVRLHPGRRRCGKCAQE